MDALKTAIDPLWKIRRWIGISIYLVIFCIVEMHFEVGRKIRKSLLMEFCVCARYLGIRCNLADSTPRHPNICMVDKSEQKKTNARATAQ